MQLPFEILAEIACFSPANVWTFASVCRHWRYATLLYPKCWATIHLKRQTVFKGEPSPDAYKSLQLWAERAGGSQLELLIQEPFHHSLFPGPFATTLSNIHTLHLNAWPKDNDPQLKSFTFPCLEVLSISATPSNQSNQMTLGRLFDVFLGTLDGPEGEITVKAPRLRGLALSGVLFDIPTFPRLAAIDSLKLSDCSFIPSLSLWDLLDQTRLNITTLFLQDTRYGSPIPVASTSRLEYRSLTSLTLTFPESSAPFLLKLLAHINAPILTKLTCDDTLLLLLDSHFLPSLSHLYIHSFRSSSLNAFKRVLKGFDLVSLTVFRDSKAWCGLNVLLWSLAQSPELGNTIKRLKYFTSQKDNLQTLLNAVNTERRKAGPTSSGTFQATQTIVYGATDNENYLPWGECSFIVLNKISDCSPKIPRYGGPKTKLIALPVAIVFAGTITF